MIKIYIDTIFNPLTPVIFATIEQLLEVQGWQSKLVNNSNDADIIYSQNQKDFKTISCAGPEAWTNIYDSKPIVIDNMVLPSKAITNDIGGKVDLIVSAFFFLSGFHERFNGVIQHYGIPGEGIGSWGILDNPTVQILSRNLSTHIKKLPNIAKTKPMWPSGKKWVCCLTHDCDRFFLYRPLGYIKDSLLCLKRGELHHGFLNISKSIYSLIYKMIKNDPYFSSWKSWIQFEEDIGIRSAYYLGSRNKYEKKSSMRNFSYAYDDERIKRVIHDLIKRGWEIGLHSSVWAWREEQMFLKETKLLENEYNIKIKGFRGHFWSLDSENQTASLALAHKVGGVFYDSSLGMNVVHGYRRGMAYPYRPYDSVTGEYAGLWELPPTIMDQSVYLGGKNNKERIEGFIHKINNVKQNNGLAVIDFHTDSLCEGFMENIVRDLLPVLKGIKKDGECWFATPWEIIKWTSKKRWEAS